MSSAEQLLLTIGRARACSQAIVLVDDALITPDIQVGNHRSGGEASSTAAGRLPVVGPTRDRANGSAAQPSNPHRAVSLGRAGLD